MSDNTAERDELAKIRERSAKAEVDGPVTYAEDDRAALLAALDAALGYMDERAKLLRSTADTLNQQVINRDPDRDVDAAVRYNAYASTTEAAARELRVVVAKALEGSL